MKSVIQQYYDLETNGEIHWQWDLGFIVKFDFQPNGTFKETRFVRTWQEVEKIFEDKLRDK